MPEVKPPVEKRARRFPLPLCLAGAAVCVLVAGDARPVAAADPDRGAALFAEKGCARCHQPRGRPASGPALEELRRRQGAMDLAGRLWNHIPGMVAALASGSAEWPRIDRVEMGDLMAYLQADPGRDPRPDLDKGRLVLLRKDCLKCHSLRGEGGPVKPDLAERREDYESAAAWAATAWSHNPRMAAMARRQGIPYPLFSGDEMAHLVAFLGGAAQAPAVPAGRR